VNILFLSQLLPHPLDAGPKVRSHYVLRYLAQGHRLTLAAFTRPSDTPASLAVLEQICARVISVPMQRARWRDGLAAGRALLSGEPFLITRDASPAMDAALRRALSMERFDAIHVDQLWMAPFALRAAQLAEKKGRRPLLVLDQHNAVFQVPRRMATHASSAPLRGLLRLEARRMASFEARTCARFDRVVWVTAEDAAATGRAELDRVIPICLDPSETEPVQIGDEACDLLFVGGMHWPPNAEGVRWFWREVFPLLPPDARLVAVGKSPPAELRGSQILAPGYVADVEPYWRSARAFVVPLLSGGGMRIKILDAWAHGVPVISTTLGAEGIQCRHGEDILLADTPAEFAFQAGRMLSDPALARRIGASGRAALLARYDWRQVYPAWDEVYTR
jgi:polysaccharide biosynthesis protein PslH